MNRMTPIPSTARPDSANPLPVVAGPASAPSAVGASRVLRNTYALLSMTLLFSAAIAAAGVALQWPAPEIGRASCRERV